MNDGKERLARYLCVGAVLAVCVASVLAYLKLTAVFAGSEILLFSESYLYPVAVISMLASAAAVAEIRYGGRKIPTDGGESEDDGDGEDDAEDFGGEAPSGLSDDSAADGGDGVDWNEYSELFRRDSAKDTSEYRVPDIKKVLSSQKTEIPGETAQPEKTESDDDRLWEDYLYGKKSDDDSAEINIFDGLPEELPEDYVPAVTEETDEADDYYDDDEPPPRTFGTGAKIAGALIAAAVCAITVLAASRCFVSADDAGVSVSGVFSERSYTWEDVQSYAVDSTFLGNTMLMRLTMNDGRTVKLVPEDLSPTEKFESVYKSPLQYAAHVDAVLEGQGTDKVIKNSAAIEEAYKGYEDGSWKYISYILGIEE